VIRSLTARLPVAARALTLVLNAALAVVVGRLFGATASGEFFLAFAIVNLAGMLGRLGSENLAIKILPALYSSGEAAEFWGQMRWLKRVCLWGSGVVAAILLAAGMAWNAFGVQGDVGLHLAILAVSIPFTCTAILHSSALRSADRISRGAFSETGLSQGLTILSIVVATAFFDVPAIVVSISYTAASILTAATAIAWTRGAVPRPSTPVPVVTKPRSEVRSMLQMMGSSVLYFLLTTGPLYALGIAGTVREVGLYNAAARASIVISLIPSLQTTYLVPRVARALAGGDLAGANAQLRRAVRLGSALGVAIAVLMLTFSELIVSIFGDDFDGARPTLLVLIVGQTLILLIGNVNPLMAVAGLERSSLVFAAIAVAVGIPLMLIAAYVGGAVAVAIVFITATIAYSLSSALLLNSRLGVRCFIS
jgi:O-antigen/teichoic acid export membrane protein